jgi:hypothetical protein
MSLATDSIFISAIKSNSNIMERIGGRLYSTAIPLPDDDADNVPVPYIIVTFDGLTNGGTSKDEMYEADTDEVTISVEVTAENRSALAQLVQSLRECIRDYMLDMHEQSEDFHIEDYLFTAEAVQFDHMKPCYWQTLRYVCDVTNDYEYGSY